MNALSPDLCMYVAEQTIIKRFKISAKEHRQLWHLAEFCKLEPEDSKRYQTYLSLQRYKINMAVVDIVLRGLTQEMRDFARLCGLSIDSRLKFAAVKLDDISETIDSEFGSI